MHVASGKLGLFTTKKDLKAAVANGDKVRFRDTSFFAPKDYDVETVGKTIFLVGPSETIRKWYAQVLRNGAGKVIVK